MPLDLSPGLPRPFLDVAASALGRPWRERCGDPGQQALAATMTQGYGLPDLLARVLVGRGVRPTEAEAYLNPRLRDLMPDPAILVDMEAAVDRLARAVRAREAVAIFGDYDVDGASSAALLASYLRALDVPVRIHIPDRITEGYGPNVGAVTALREEGHREAALITFLVTLSGVVVAGVGSAFWGVVAGSLALFVQQYGRSRIQGG